MMKINTSLTPKSLLPQISELFKISGTKILAIHKRWKPESGTPVFTVKGKYTTRGWTEWTQGFQFGSSLLQFDAEGDRSFLDNGIQGTLSTMASHVSHIGVHDHGFNNISTYGNLLRLYREEKVPRDSWAEAYCELALKVSGAVQAARWTSLPDNLGYIYSFNGPHSLFVDTIRSLRVLSAAHTLGHVLMGEQDRKISLLERMLQHAEATARYNVYFGEGRDIYDIRGRAVHEAIFNVTNGAFRCPSTQQGYSPFTTWTRGQAWALAGYPEQLEYLDALPEQSFKDLHVADLKNKTAFVSRFLQTSIALADFYIEQTPVDGIPYWDTGAPGLVNLPDWRDRPADPFNDYEPVDSSAAAIAAQGLLRLGNHLQKKGKASEGKRYFQAGLTVASALFAEPYLSTDSEAEGLILHSVYHRPNGWDHIPKGKKVPCGEATMWGDYHARELALYIKKIAERQPYYDFWSTL
ncbi:MAG: glycoside hydrolase family 88 protein [Spirochaetaceae bacterium]|nr:MAG: glycoside hydrolase family 88 protein [Spirochaetaceae bacterium]